MKPTNINIIVGIATIVRTAKGAFFLRFSRMLLSSAYKNSEITEKPIYINMGGKQKKRKNFHFGRIFIAVAVIFSINFVLWQLWQDNIPWLKVFHQKTNIESSAITESNSGSFTEISFSDTLLAQTAARDFISFFPPPGGKWKAYPAEETVKGSVLDIVCPDSKILNPIVQAQKEWRLNEFNTIRPSQLDEEDSEENVIQDSSRTEFQGIVGQVKIYHPGMGAVVFSDLKKQASSCGSKNKWNVNGITSTGSIGQESFTYSYSMAGERNTATVFREGDIIGIVYGTNNVDTISLASDWNTRWQKDLRKFCINPKSTIDDAKRQPLYNKYVGYQAEARVSLTDADKVFLSQTVSEKVNKKYGINNNSDNMLFYNNSTMSEDKPESLRLPKEPRLEPGEELEILSPYQTFIPVSIPTAPKKPIYPKEPGSEPKTEIFYGPAEDVRGPGCGWKLIGQEKPVIDKISYDEEWNNAKREAQDRLNKKYVDWAVSTWQYAIEYDEYVYNVKVWNNWVKESNQIVSTAEWAKYDEDSENYPNILEEYEIQLDIWRSCANTIPLPPPTPIIPEPDPTEEPSPDPIVEEENGSATASINPVLVPTVVEYQETLEERQEIRRKEIVKKCGFRPTKPRQPVEPDMPRPVTPIVSPSIINNLDSGSLPDSIIP